MPLGQTECARSPVPAPGPCPHEIVTKCRILAAGIGAGGAFFFAVGLATNGVARMLAWYVTLACTLSAFAYLTNRPGIYGKSDGRLVPWRAVATLPFLVAYGIAALIRTSMRSYATWNEVEPGLFVAVPREIGRAHV